MNGMNAPKIVHIHLKFIATHLKASYTQFP